MRDNAHYWMTFLGFEAGYRERTDDDDWIVDDGDRLGEDDWIAADWIVDDDWVVPDWIVSDRTGIDGVFAGRLGDDDWIVPDSFCDDCHQKQPPLVYLWP